MTSYLWLPWLMPTLDELLAKRGVVYGRAGRLSATKLAKRPPQVSNGYSVAKKQWHACIGLLARSRGFSVAPGCWRFTYLFVETTARRDPSNIASGATKLIEDALVVAGLMDGDGWATVHSITSYFSKSKDAQISTPGILLAVGPVTPTQSEMISQAKVMCHAEAFHRKQRRRTESDSPDPQ